MEPIVHIDPEILGGTPVFRGTRVPVRSLFDYLTGGYSVDEFLYQFPTVKKDQVIALLNQLADNTESSAPRAVPA